MDEEELSSQELNLLVKLLTAMPDLPKIDMGESGHRGEKLKMWKVSMRTQLQATRPVVEDWWRWCGDISDATYQR